MYSRAHQVLAHLQWPLGSMFSLRNDTSLADNAIFKQNSYGNFIVRKVLCTFKYNKFKDFVSLSISQAKE